MITKDLDRIRGADVVGPEGEKIGTVSELFFDDATQRPEWASVKSGLLGRKMTLVPLVTSDWQDGQVRIPYKKEELVAAPSLDSEDRLSVEEEARLFEHYGLPYGGETATAEPGAIPPGGYTGTGAASAGPWTAGTELPRTPGTAGDGATETDGAMTVSEEQVRVGVERREAGRARLHKYIVTEQVATTVPVTREEVRLEREPITEANRAEAMSGPDLGEADHEVVLHEEVPVVEKQVVPKERVRLSAEPVTEERTIETEVRKEQVEEQR